MDKSTAEAYGEFMAIICTIILAILAGFGVIESIGYAVGNVVIFIVLVMYFKVLDKIGEGP